MEIADIVTLALDGQYDEVLSQIEKLPPRAIHEFIMGFYAIGKDEITDFEMHLSKDQSQKWQWLNSSKRTVQYIMSMPEEERTEQEWADLRACDF